MEQEFAEGIDSWETMMFLYNSALKEVNTKLEILNDEFVHIHKYNPIEYIKSRIKTPESIVKKLKRDGYESTIENMRNYINDIAGIRIVCSFTSDIYRLAEMIGKQNDLTVICVKDYIKNPKVSGYKSFHMHVTVPIFLSDRVVDTKVEIQIRTIAMDFWASLEHKIYYKFEGHAPEYISRDLRACAEIVSNLDAKMLQLNEAILEEKEKEAVKANVINLLKQYYDMEEEDFLSAELEIVPAGKARELGMDASMILAYGQDDRVCAYTSLVAMLEVEAPEKTSCCLLVDKEEIGSVGATGMQSHFFENTMAELLALAGEGTELALRRCLASSRMLSSDVSAAFDPLYAAAFEKKNAAFFGKGIVINKFTGAGGKSGSNDANAEYVGALRAIFDDAKVNWQTAELGKVDVGGGGTIAYIMSLYGMEVIDSGVPVLSMHAPWEVTSKADVYEAKKAYVAFLKNA